MFVAGRSSDQVTCADRPAFSCSLPAPVLLSSLPCPSPVQSLLFSFLGRAEVECDTDCGVTDGRDGAKHGSVSDGGYDWGRPRTLSPSPVDRTGSGTNYGVATTRLLTHSATTAQEKTEPGGGIHDAISATPDSYITTEEECETGSNELGLTSLLIRSPRNIAFRCGMKPSSSTYIMCSSHYWLSRFL